MGVSLQWDIPRNRGVVLLINYERIFIVNDKIHAISQPKRNFNTNPNPSIKNIKGYYIQIY